MQVVPVPIATRWLAGGAESGALGVPTGAAASVLSLSGISSNIQAFAGGDIVGEIPVASAAKAYAVSGAILTAYLAGGGPGSVLGLPVGEVQTSAGVLSQYFENCYIRLNQARRLRWST